MSDHHTGRQHNIYFGRNKRDDTAYEVVQRLGKPVSDLFKQVLLQIGDGTLTVDPLTLRVDANTDHQQHDRLAILNDDLHRMVHEIHQVIKSGQLRLVSDDQPAAVSPDGVPEIAVSREVMDAFNGMDD